MISFMTQALSFLALILLLVIAYSVYIFIIKKASFASWRANEGKGAVASAALGIGTIIIIAGVLWILSSIIKPAHADSIFDNGTYFNHTYVFIGIDYTKKISPQCVSGSTDEHGTSNLGINQNFWLSSNKAIAINGQLTHHSCVLGKDRNGYDGLGLQLVWYIK